MLGGRQIGRITLALALSGALLATVGAGGASAKGGGGLKLKTGTLADQALLDAGAIKVKLRSPNARKVKLKAVASGSGTALTAVKKVKAPAGKLSVKLNFSRGGSTMVEACGVPQVTVQALARRKGGKGSRVVARTKKAVSTSVAQCKALATSDRCETIAAPGSNCLFPWPSNHFTRTDPTTGTGLRVNVSKSSTPVNQNGVSVDPEDINRSDGFSPGPSIVTHVPGLDNPTAMQKTGVVPVTDMDRAFDANQPVVLIDAANGQRQLLWAEIDSNATTAANADLIIRPGKNLTEGHRYIVALRNLKNSAGAEIPAPPGFAVYRDALTTDVPSIEKRRAGFEDVFAKLKSAGIARADLYDAWDFTVASTDNITGRMISIRDRALATLGETTPGDGVIDGDAPDFTITDVKTVDDPGNPLTGDHTTENVREVTGTYEVPCYLDEVNCPVYSQFDIGSDGLPERIPGNTMTARFTCNIPQSAVTETSPGSGSFTVNDPVRTSMYGHGLFGDYTEVHTGDVRKLGNDHDVVTCATDFTGMSENDVPAAFLALLDLSHFQAIPDGLQQGFVNFIFLGRLLANPDGFASDPAFKFGGDSVVDPSLGTFYYGNSQGGIAGGALTAVEPDITRTVLYVPGMNYSMLLTRSIDFQDYASVLYPAYSDQQERPLLLSMIQMMWDRGEPNGFANHMTGNPLPGTPEHKVLIEMAYGDHQVSNVTTAVEARTIGAPLRYPTLDPGRTPGFTDFFPALPALGTLPGPAEDGNGFFAWDIGPKRDNGLGGFLGTDPAPITNTSPNDSFGVDPHDTVIRQTPEVREQIATFLQNDGTIIDPCGADPCYAAGWTGP